MTRQLSTPLTLGWTLHHHRPAADGPTVAAVPATVPGCVHTDLLDHGLISEPFADTNEADLMWIADSDWRYSCSFDVTDEHLGHEHLDLAVDGLDTLATIIVNGRVVANTANMHRRYRFDIRELVDVGANRLEIVFASATEYTEALRAAEGTWPSASFGRSYNYLRKMACSWGWDWGPWLTTAGIWRQASIVAWSGGRISDVRPTATISDDDHGSVRIEVELFAVEAGSQLEVNLTDPRGTSVATATMPATSGIATVVLDAGHVERWWPHSYGEQPLYRVTVQLVDSNDAERNVATRRIGFRTIELDTTTDLQGSSFTFVVNGRPVFVRGVNWIPDDIFVTRITDDDYRQRLGQAIDANVDMIRIWGGGIYEDDRFYDTCDEIGLLVWQDFAFACAAYPEHLLADEVEAEARDNVSRLMHHTSLAIWNGNNENIWGYWDWAWQEVLLGRTWGAGFYHDLLPTVCAELDPTRPYWPGSPYSGSDDVAPNADAHGCVHVWDVWNQVDLIRYRDHTPRFVAEFGWQAPPSMTTLAGVVSPDQMHRKSPAWLSHQKATDGDLKLDRGIHARFGEITDFDSFWFAAQVVQARAITTGVEHFRSLRPYCMGTIWWQLNDCWPVTSWAVIDSEARQKPSYYALREAYRPQLLTVQPRGDRLVLFALNETGETWVVSTRGRRIDLRGNVIAEADISLTVEPGGSASFELPARVATSTNPDDEVLIVGSGAARTWWWFADDRDMSVAPVQIAWTVRQLDDGAGADATIEFIAVSSVVVRDLTIYPERVHPDGRIDRQLVDLEPGVPETFRVTGVPLEMAEQLTRRPACWHAAAVIAHS